MPRVSNININFLLYLNIESKKNDTMHILIPIKKM